MSGINLSPEEILKNKEIKGGLVYDDPIQKNTEIPEKIDPIINSVDPVNIPKEPISSKDLSWKNLPLKTLPSKGIFYSEGTRIAIRPALVKEIKYFSTIDESDDLDIEEKLNYILEACSAIKSSDGSLYSYMDILQEDRFFIIMAIRDLTFVRGENSIMLKPNEKCKDTDCVFSKGIELRTGTLGSYEIDPRIMDYYESSTKSFSFFIKKIGKKVEMYIPTIGVNRKISEFILECNLRGIEIPDSDVSILPFLFKDWRSMNFQNFLSKLKEMGDENITKEEYSLLLELSNKLKTGTKNEIVQDCPKCGAKGVTAEITFPGGLRSLFVISDIFGQLL